MTSIFGTRGVGSVAVRTAQIKAWRIAAPRLLFTGCMTALLIATSPSTAALAANGCVPADGWLSAWTMGQISPTATYATANGAVQGFTNQTLREEVHVTAGGNAVRLKFSDAFGQVPLTISAASVAVQRLTASTQTTPVPVSFAGGKSVTIPAGGQMVSDPVPLTVAADSMLAVSMYFQAPTGPVSWHFVALSQSYLTNETAGDQTMDSSGAPFSSTTTVWDVLSEVDVYQPAYIGSVVAFGDSITDGFNSTFGANHRYPDYLARRLQSAGIGLSVADAGIGGNLVTKDEMNFGGPSGVSRFGRDALGQSGVRTIILLEGINDIHGGVAAADIIAGLKNIVQQAHAASLTIIGATLTPSGDTGAAEAARQTINAFVRTTGSFDTYVDFDAAVRDPANPRFFLPQYDSGDHLHPSDAGYSAMADSVDLSGLLAQANAACAPSPSIPESPSTALLVAIGIAGGALAVRLRRRKGLGHDARSLS